MCPKSPSMSGSAPDSLMHSNRAGSCDGSVQEDALQAAGFSVLNLVRHFGNFSFRQTFRRFRVKSRSSTDMTGCPGELGRACEPRYRLVTSSWPKHDNLGRRLNGQTEDRALKTEPENQLSQCRLWRRDSARNPICRTGRGQSRQPLLGPVDDLEPAFSIHNSPWYIFSSCVSGYIGKENVNGLSSPLGTCTDSIHPARSLLKHAWIPRQVVMDDVAAIQVKVDAFRHYAAGNEDLGIKGCIESKRRPRCLVSDRVRPLIRSDVCD